MKRASVVALTTLLAVFAASAVVAQTGGGCPCMGGKCPMASNRSTQSPGGRMGMRRGMGPGMGGGMGPGAGMGMRNGMGQRRGVGPMGGGGMGPGMGPGMGRGPDGAMRQDMATFHALLADHQKIRRTVTQLFDGVDTLTESDDPDAAKLIKEHVPAMYSRLKSGRGIHLVDPLFAELFKNGKKIDQTITLTDKGVRVIEQSTDPYTVKLIKAHAASVDDLVKRGMAGFMELHEPPKR